MSWGINVDWGGLANVSLSALCDVDKSLPVVDPVIRPLTAARLCGPAFTVQASGEFLSVLWAISEAAAGDVLVVQAGGTQLAVLGELLANEAERRGLGGIVVDGYVRDRSGLPPELPLWARGTVPVAGRSDVIPTVGVPILFGGVEVLPGDFVLADGDGMVIASRGRLEACLTRAEEIDAVENAVLSGIREGANLIAMTNLIEHVERLRVGELSRLVITPSS